MVVAGLVAPFTFRNDPGPLKFMKVGPLGEDGVRHLGSTPVHVRRPPPSRVQEDRRLARRSPARTSGAECRGEGAPCRLAGKVGFWVTEFSWDSKPPDTRGVPLALEAQWVSEALFRAWQAGVTDVHLVPAQGRARPSPFQSGLYFRSWKAKPALTAFRFPFVALRRSRSVYVWGRTPGDEPATAIVERRAAGRGSASRPSRRTRPASSRARFRLTLPPSAFMRARITGARSIAFPLRLPPDKFVNPFGS